MNRIKLLQKLLLFFMIVLKNSAYSQEVSNNFIVTQTYQYGEKVIQITTSETNNSILGTIQLYDSDQKLVKEVKNVELIKAPYYTTISVEGLSEGNYQIKVFSDSLVYSQTIFINK
jgi:hypothetical protein